MINPIKDEMFNGYFSDTNWNPKYIKMINIHHKGIRCKVIVRAKSSLKGSGYEKTRNWRFHLQLGSSNWGCHLEIQFGNPPKVKYIIAMWPSDSTSRPIPTRGKYKLLHIDIYRLITIVFKKQEQHISQAD